jgi:hypothetical protein
MLEKRKKVQKTSQKLAFLQFCCGGLRGESYKQTAKPTCFAVFLNDKVL